jgi:hypothetical protein
MDQLNLMLFSGEILAIRAIFGRICTVFDRLPALPRA